MRLATTQYARGLLVLVLLLPCTHLAHAQTVRATINGTVTDTTGLGLQGATVVLLSQPDSVLAHFAISGRDGRFTLRRIPADTYILQVTFVGFAPLTQALTVQDSEVDVGTLVLQEATGRLGELVVNAERVPIVVKRDTLEYNAAAFAPRPGSNVEDLLRRLPGVEVDDNGTIRAQGETVQNVLVDGKEFFGDNPQMATRNLPAEAIEKVQVYDKQSDMAEFTGVDDGQEEKTINLELTEDAKRGYFGQISGGFGADERYDGQVSVNRFSPRTQLSLIGNANNVNRQGFGAADYIQFMGGLQALMADGGGSLRLGGPGIPLGTDLSDGFSQTFSVGLNANYDFSESLSIWSSYFLNSLDNRQDRTVFQEQPLGRLQAATLTEESLQQSDRLGHQFNLTARQAFSDGHDLRLRSTFSLSNTALTNRGDRATRDASGSLASTSLTDYGTEGDDVGGNATLTWRKRLTERGHSLVAEARAALNASDLKADLTNATTFFEAGDVLSYTELVQAQARTGNTFQQRQRLAFIYPVRGVGSFELGAERRQTQEDQDKRIEDLVDGVPVLNPLLSEGFDRTYTYYEGGIRFNRRRKAFSFGVGVEVQTADLDGRIIGRDEAVEGRFTNVLPSANLSWAPRVGMNLDARYTTRTREPSMNELQPFVDNRDPLNVYVGNPDLIPEYRHDLSLRYLYFDQFSFLNVMAFARVSRTQDAIVRARTVDDQLRQEVTSINGGDAWSVNATTDVGTPIRPLGVQVNLGTRSLWDRSFERVNNVENDTRTLRTTVEARLGNRRKDDVDLSGGTRFTFNRVAYSLSDELDQQYVNRTFFGDVTWYLGETWEVQAGLRYRQFTQDVFGGQDDVALLEATVTKRLFNDRIEVVLTGQDLLDQNVGVNFANTATFVQEERIASLGRYFMLKLVYRLSDFGGRSGGRGGGIEVRRFGD
ncbi:MAG: TonB-dependent receptor [Bacteroidota bacterium]